jgi:hypothetical protein
MALALFITFGGGGDGGPSGALVAVLLVVALIGVPAAVGLFLRFRDSRRSETGPDRPETKSDRPLASGVFDASWGRSQPFDVRARSTRRDWIVVGAFATGLLVLYLATRI